MNDFDREMDRVNVALEDVFDREIKREQQEALVKAVGITFIGSGSSFPIQASVGDMWHSTVNDQDFVFDGANWVLLAAQPFDEEKS